MDGYVLLMLPALILVIFSGFPVALAMMGVSLVFGLIRYGDAAVYLFAMEIHDVAGNYVLASIPLFVFMGSLLESTGIAERLFRGIHVWTHKVPGGLAVGTVLMGVVFAMSSGVVGATETVIGLLALPIMLSYGYNKSLISGTVCAGGSLGTAIPPSVVVIILAPVVEVSVGRLFAGILFPGLLMALTFILYIMARAIIDPSSAPRHASEVESLTLLEKLTITISGLLPPIFLIFTVLGTILLGWATPTEAAACGAVGTLFLALLARNLKLHFLWRAMKTTLSVSTMILTILVAGHIFSGVFVALGGVRLTQDLIQTANVGPWTVLAIILFIAFIGGFVLDLVSVVLILVPIAVPIIADSGFDLIWFSVLFLIVLQTGYLSPPMAPSIFYLRAIAPPEIKLSHMFRGVVPFIAAQVFCLVLVLVFPEVAIWLPNAIFAN
ncbi:MAG: C4-dicarboxylate ABC transporter permease [Blastopirellula sp.]|nr:MAG: C4-dicarboxylate ABC transporter permease [Blastopirellula sp.]